MAEKPARKQNVVITGCGAGGIGAALAVEFHRKEFKVFATDVKLARMAELAAYPDIVRIEMDVTDAQAVQGAIQKIQSQTDAIDIVVNNAGVFYWDPVLNTDVDTLDTLWNVNFKGAFNVCKSVIPLMIRQRDGMIVNMTSDTSMFSTKWSGIYNAIEMGIKEMNKSLKLELSCFNLDIVLVQPRWIQSNFVKNTLVADDLCAKESPFSGIQKEITGSQVEYESDQRMTREVFARELAIELLKRNDVRYQYYYFFSNPLNLLIYGIFYAACYWFPVLVPAWKYFKYEFWYMPDEIIIGDSIWHRLGVFLFELLPPYLQWFILWMVWGLDKLNYGELNHNR